MILVVDTHALIWYLEDSPRLGRVARSLLMDPLSRLAVPTIVLAEAHSLEETGRTKLSWDEILSALEADPRFTVFPLTLDVLRRMPKKKGLEMHDAIICATSVLLSDLASEDVNVVTKDRRIVESALVNTVW